MLKDSSQTNQAYMTVGDPSTVDMKDPPCLRGIQCRVRYGQLHFIVYFRSWDLWAGFPSNMAALQIMKEYMAREIGLPDGSLMAVSPGLHLYDHSWDLAKMVLRDV
jgi:thymidylate synthase